VPADAPAPRVPLVPFGSAAAGVMFALTPTPALALEITAGLRRAHLSAELAGRVETTVGDPRLLSGDQVDATVFSALLYPCLQLGPWQACASGRVGVLQGHASDVAHPVVGSNVIGALGLRGAFALPLTRALDFRVAAQVEALLVRTTFHVGDAPVWIAPPVAAGGVAGLVLHVD